MVLEYKPCGIKFITHAFLGILKFASGKTNGKYFAKFFADNKLVQNVSDEGTIVAE